MPLALLDLLVLRFAVHFAWLPFLFRLHLSLSDRPTKVSEALVARKKATCLDIFTRSRKPWVGRRRKKLVLPNLDSKTETLSQSFPKRGSQNGVHLGVFLFSASRWLHRHGCPRGSVGGNEQFHAESLGVEKGARRCGRRNRRACTTCPADVVQWHRVEKKRKNTNKMLRAEKTGFLEQELVTLVRVGVEVHYSCNCSCGIERRTMETQHGSNVLLFKS